MGKVLKEFVISILINSLLLFVVSEYINELGFKIISSQHNQIITFVIIGGIFRFLNNIIKRILNIVTLPIKIITFGLSSSIINIAIFYTLQYILSQSNLGITIQLGNILQILILSLIITIAYFLIKKII